MQIAALLFCSVAAATYLPTASTNAGTDEGDLLQRTTGPPESCSALWTGADTFGYTCAKSGYLSYPDFLGAVDVSSAANYITGCITECERNPGCMSMSLERSNNLCSLWGKSLYAMGFQEESESNIWGDRQCWTFTGSRCDVHSGNFEPALGVPQIEGLVHPWDQQDPTTRTYGTNFTFVKSGTKAAQPVPKTPYGQNFARATIRDFNGVAAISQYIYPDMNSNYALSFAYNFASFKQLSGTLKPKHYVIETLYCGVVYDTLEIPIGKADKKWKTHSFTSTPICNQQTEFSLQIRAEEDDSTASGLFEAVIALDNVRFIPHARS